MARDVNKQDTQLCWGMLQDPYPLLGHVRLSTAPKCNRHFGPVLKSLMYLKLCFNLCYKKLQSKLEKKAKNLKMYLTKDFQRRTLLMNFKWLCDIYENFALYYSLYILCTRKPNV